MWLRLASPVPPPSARAPDATQPIQHGAPGIAHGALFKIDEQMSGAAVIERIEESVRNSNPSLLLRLPLLGEIIGIEIADNPTTASLDAKLRQEALQSLAVELLQAGARRSPLVLLAEDVHWMDEASQSLLLALANA